MPVYFKQLADLNVNYIYDLLDNKGDILSLEELQRKFNCSLNYLNYYSLMNAIPKEWKICLIEHPVQNVEFNTFPFILLNSKYYNITKLKSKDFYWQLVNSSISVPTSQLKWSEIYPNIDFDWKSIYSLPYFTSRETKLQTFQYKILHRFFPCNYYVSKWNNEVESLCLNCGLDDTLEHYFFDCALVYPFWDTFKKWWFNLHNVLFNFNKTDIIFGIANTFNDIMIETLNFCILIAKWLIFRCKYLKKVCSFFEYMFELRTKLDIEKYILYTQNKGDVFENKWNTIYYSL